VIRFVISIALALGISCGGQAAAPDKPAPFAATATTASSNRQTSAPATFTSTPPPTVAPTVVPATVAPTVRPATTPPTVAPTVNLCGAPANPWNYTFCGGSFITSPPSNFCGYFNCIASFANGRGYVMQCADRTYSKSGGISGSCSGHGGNARALYAP
jgi:hypothetical protein